MNECLNMMVEAAKAAGRVIVSGLSDVRIVGPDKTALHPHTNTDLAADAVIREVLGPCLDKRTGLLTEEQTDNPDRLTMGRVFIVDPIDGTHSLLEGTQDAVVSIALSQYGQIIEAVVFNPFTGELWTAQKGAGAFQDNRRLRVTPCENLADATFLMSNTEHKTGRLDIFKGRLNFTTRGSIAYKCVLVASGQAQGHFTVHERSEWDVAAAALIVEEAGGKVTDRQGKDLVFNQPNPVFNGIICTHPLLLKPLLKLLDGLGL